MTPKKVQISNFIKIYGHTNHHKPKTSISTYKKTSKSLKTKISGNQLPKYLKAFSVGVPPECFPNDQYAVVLPLPCLVKP